MAARPRPPHAAARRALTAVPTATAALLLGALAAATLAGCSNTQASINREPQSGSATASMVNGVQQVHIDAGDDYRFHPAVITVHPGKVRIVLQHTGNGAPHDWQLTKFPKDNVALVQPGQTHSTEFTAPAPGRYRFICTIHVRQGQVGTMIVTP